MLAIQRKIPLAAEHQRLGIGFAERHEFGTKSGELGQKSLWAELPQASSALLAPLFMGKAVNAQAAD